MFSHIQFRIMELGRLSCSKVNFKLLRSTLVSWKIIDNCKHKSISQYLVTIKNQPPQNCKIKQCFFSNNLPIIQQIRSKYSSKKTTRNEDEDLNTDNDSDDDFEQEKDSKVIKTKLNSLRADLVLKSGLGMARNKIEAIFYESRIRVNGKKLPKKSLQLNIGDEIDIIKGVSSMNPAHLLVARVIILSAAAAEENLSVNLRRFKSLVIDNYEGQNAWKGPPTQ